MLRAVALQSVFYRNFLNQIRNLIVIEKQNPPPEKSRGRWHIVTTLNQAPGWSSKGNAYLLEQKEEAGVVVHWSDAGLAHQPFRVMSNIWSSFGSSYLMTLGNNTLGR